MFSKILDLFLLYFRPKVRGGKTQIKYNIVTVSWPLVPHTSPRDNYQENPPSQLITSSYGMPCRNEIIFCEFPMYEISYGYLTAFGNDAQKH